MEIKIFGHSVSLYGAITGFIFRIYDNKGYAHLTFSTMKNNQYGLWVERYKTWGGDWKRQRKS